MTARRVAAAEPPSALHCAGHTRTKHESPIRAPLWDLRYYLICSWSFPWPHRSVPRRPLRVPLAQPSDPLLAGTTMPVTTRLRRRLERQVDNSRHILHYDSKARELRLWDWLVLRSCTGISRAEPSQAYERRCASRRTSNACRLLRNGAVPRAVLLLCDWPPTRYLHRNSYLSAKRRAPCRSARCYLR